ncbi:TadE/TadG family type IV pilus assembly protein [Alkalibacillus haloalkaliphilus]|uniref:TadE-like domain-containing protein n=1 Tax=Alkalibacillus haloalkaliphilus TaxID=94136 RepID=A0A511W031_9BACI|nr:TadE/TadG family type IV pilus assembly protein [Alkalibacillus haloalkaliphilus]MDV2581345.1 TadE/TadG family type IV pilus assembly protein [Alkalibacillus haloalkaliphilus]GEN44406.1 hypothetical protein AHA02nite_01820 [Alkalibacillus haloalkaliphilus]
MRRNEKGQSMVEFALIIPLLLFMLVGVFDIGRMLYTYTGLHFTAQETVRLGGFGYEDEAIMEFAKENFQTGSSDQLVVEISPSEDLRSPGEYVTVTLNYPIEPFTPFASQIFSDAVTLSSDSTIRIE